jgi:hypothetical protein
VNRLLGTLSDWWLAVVMAAASCARTLELLEDDPSGTGAVAGGAFGS